MDKKKLYFVRANRTKFGGAEVYLSRLSKALDHKNISHSTMHSRLPKFLPSWIRVILFNWQVCLTKGDRFYFSLDRISCPDIYRAGDGVHKVFLEVEKKSKLNPLHPIYLFLEKRCFQRARRIIANSNMIREQIMDTYQINPDKVKVVYNGIRLEETDQRAAFRQLSAEFSISQDKHILLYVGSGFKRKGVKEFLELLSELGRSDFQAFIVGKEKNLKYYCSLAEQLGLGGRVIFTGPREDVQRFYAISDVFILPTHYEPFSNVVLEAMSHKNAVFTTRQNGASEILESEFIMQSPADLSVAETINGLLNDKERLIQAQVNNYNTARQFSIEKNLEETYQVINEVIN